MRKFILGLVVFLAFSGTGLHAHGPEGGHGPEAEITESQAGVTAAQYVGVIVKKGKLDASWAQVKAAAVQKKVSQNGPEWIVTFHNPGEKDAAKQKLYLFLSPYGNYLGANHTGK